MTYADISISARVSDVHARIAALQNRFGAPPAAVAGTTATQFGTMLSDAVANGAPAVAAGAAPLSSAVAVARPNADPQSGALGQQAVEVAKQQLGKPYVWGAQSPSVGFDCSGLVQHTFKQLGVDLPRVSRDQARAGQPVQSLKDARPGDLIAFGSPVNHIGIYAGNNKMVVAPHRGDVVKVQEVYRTPTAIRRVV
jgi:cell wall-associated NlpC family hydrolase